jgi:hypothetical protein
MAVQEALALKKGVIPYEAVLGTAGFASNKYASGVIIGHPHAKIDVSAYYFL